jgi:hypothetical protein
MALAVFLLDDRGKFKVVGVLGRDVDYIPWISGIRFRL